MARKPRIEYAGAIYYVFAAADRDFAASPADAEQVLDLTSELCRRYDLQMFAYTFLPSEYHLVFKTRRANLSQAMQWFAANLTRRCNRAHGRSGPLFSKRYKSVIIENESYLPPVFDHVHALPAAAGLVDEKAAYEWSSEKAFAGRSDPPPWLHLDVNESTFREKRYDKTMDDILMRENRIVEDAKNGRVMRSGDVDAAGYDDIHKKLQAAAAWFGRSADELLAVSKKPTPARSDRELLIYGLYDCGKYTNHEIADLFGVTNSSISHLARRYKNRINTDQALKIRLKNLKKALDSNREIAAANPEIVPADAVERSIDQHIDLAERGAANEPDADLSLQAGKSRAMKRKLVRATLLCLNEYGYHGASLSRIIDRAGVSRGAWRHHYPNKKTLVAEAAKVMYAGTIQKVIGFVPTMDPGQNPLTAFLDFTRVHFHRGWHRNVWLEFTVAARTDHELRELMSPLINEFFKSVDRLADGVIESLDPELASPSLLVNLTLYLSRGMAIQSITHDDSEHFRKLVELWPKLLEGLVRLRGADG